MRSIDSRLTRAEKAAEVLARACGQRMSGIEALIASWSEEELHAAWVNAIGYPSEDTRLFEFLRRLPAEDLLQCHKGTLDGASLETALRQIGRPLPADLLEETQKGDRIRDVYRFPPETP